MKYNDEVRLPLVSIEILCACWDETADAVLDLVSPLARRFRPTISRNGTRDIFLPKFITFIIIWLARLAL